MRQTTTHSDAGCYVQGAPRSQAVSASDDHAQRRPSATYKEIRAHRRVGAHTVAVVSARTRPDGTGSRFIDHFDFNFEHFGDIFDKGFKLHLVIMQQRPSRHHRHEGSPQRGGRRKDVPRDCCKPKILGLPERHVRNRYSFGETAGASGVAATASWGRSGVFSGSHRNHSSIMFLTGPQYYI